MAVDLTLEGSQPQRRATVAFRIILAIPHWLFAGVLSSVAFVVIFFAWFAVLFTARMPTGMRDFLVRILQYQTRVYAYAQFLLTDRYPSFEIGPDDYPVMLEIDEPERFNRAAVLFRFFLQLPALVLSQLVTSGVSVILFFVWLITLVSGQMPTSAYLAGASILRYQARTWAYMGMLTSDYPRGLWGDRDSDTSAYTDLSLPSSPRVDKLVLNRGAKVLITLALVFGIGWFGFQVGTGSFDFNIGASEDLRTAGATFDHAYDAWEQRSNQCAGASTPDCQRAANAAFRVALDRYETELQFISFSAAAHDEYVAVRDDLDEIRGYLVDTTEASNPEDVMRLTFQIEDAKFLYDKHYDDLYQAAAFG